ncbi:MAG: sulfatase-like hydrolase/transferase [Planctomycetes bacterium]|nr:sulfatase-like hydrolase/transferase [Planctomycetota bacterium]
MDRGERGAGRRVGRRQFLRSAVAAAAAPAALRLAGAEERRRPNILFIMTDQQTAGAMSARGNRWVKTPAMDSIAARGVHFERSYCAAPVCGPSRSSIVTSRMPHETGVIFNGDSIRPEIPTFGEVFAAAGYRTVWAGKWHLPQSYLRRATMVRGFDYVPVESNAYGLGAETDEPVADACVRFLKGKPERPFLLAASFHNPHDICGWSGRKPEPHPDVETYPTLPDNFDVDPEEPEFIRICRKRTYYGPENTHTKTWDATQWRAYLRAYYRFTEDVDRAIGRVLAALREAGLEDDTLVVFTSDHGEGTAGHRWIVKLCLYEGPATVPLIVAWKGVTPPAVADRTHVVSSIDILPTLCAYAGIEPPAGILGRSLRPIIEDPKASHHPFVVTEVAPDTKDPSFQGRMVRTPRHKYMAYARGKDPEQLFDLGGDPGETRNLARDPGAARILNEHRDLLAVWCERTKDPFRPAGV